MLEGFETSAEKAFFLSLCATVVLGVIVAVASVRTQIGVASPGFVVWQNLIVPAIGAIGPSPEAAAVPQRTVVTSVDGAPVRDATRLRARVSGVPGLGLAARAGFVLPTIAGWREVAVLPSG